jgi:pimeloyl-ACP methyl ester carboxylesterase
VADLAKSLGGDIEALAALFEGLGRQRSPELAAVTCPTLVITGADDDMSGGSPDDLAARLPCAEAITLAGLDHLGAVFDPQFADQVIGFLGRRFPPS